MVPEFGSSPATELSGLKAFRAKSHNTTHPIPLSEFNLPAVNARPRSKSQALDLNSIEGIKPRGAKPEPKISRPLNLQEAPTYYPTEQEFKDPYAYIKSIASEGREYGIIKIVPPDSFRPSFVLDTENFWFKTRRQELNSMEGSTRAALNFLEQLRMFHKQRGMTMNRLPSVDRRPLDLFHLKKAVDMRSGFEVVCKRKLWAEIGRELGYSGKIMTSLSTSLKAAYQRYVYPYEVYLQSAKPVVQKQLEEENGGPLTPMKRQRTISGASTVSEASHPSPTTPTDAVSGDNRPILMTVEARSDRDLTSEDVHANKRQRTNDESTEQQHPTVMNSNAIMHRKTGAVKRLHSMALNRRPGENCEVCGRGDDAASMLLCDGCDNGYHMACLKPQLKSLPDYDWYCDKCLVGTADYGFEEGQIYNLRQFQEKCKNFKDHYVTNHRTNGGNELNSNEAMENFIETEFWRLVESMDETVEVEYGADIHSTLHGSGFPTVERQPLDKYSLDPWNLNVMPLTEKSLFRYIKSDISGMTLPWLYVGMVFSTFCWHMEDHNTYSINYQHFGATKTWYGIPGDDADKFENVMREEVPELFEGQPDLLFQLVTMLSPKVLTEKKVRCYAIDQRPGEFVVTFPQAYHAGFNHGFNFNEAVNFAPTDWEPYGRLGVEIYQDYRKLPVFSHDELLLTIATQDTTIDSAIWLAPALKSMADHEVKMRQHVRDMIPKLKEIQLDLELQEEEFQCAYCNAYCFLSQVLCSCTSNIVCLNHYDELCDCERTTRVLRVRMSDEELEKTVYKVSARATQPEQWMKKYEKLTHSPEEKPSIRSLRSLLAEADKIAYPIKQIDDLRKIVETANEWIEEAQGIIARKLQQRRRAERANSTTSIASRRASVRSLSITDDGRETSLPPSAPPGNNRKPEYIDDLLERVKNMPFVAPEIEQLEERQEQIEEFLERSREILTELPEDMSLYVAMIETGYGLNVELPEIEQLEWRQAQLRWKERVIDARKTYMYLQDVIDLLAEGQVLKFTADNEPIYAKLLRAEQRGLTWEREAKAQLEMEGKPDYDLLEDKYDDATTTPVTKETYDAIGRLLVKHREVRDALSNFSRDAQKDSIFERSNLKEVKKIAELLKDPMLRFDRTQSFDELVSVTESWISRGQQVFPNYETGSQSFLSFLESFSKKIRTSLAAEDVPTKNPEPVLGKHRSKPLFCICRMPESGLMIECEQCHEWYHNRCLRLPRGAVKDNDDYFCPICVPLAGCTSVFGIELERYRADLAPIREWYLEGLNIPFMTDEMKYLNQIIQTASKLGDVMEPILNQSRTLLKEGLPATEDLKSLARFYLRKLAGSGIYMADTGDILRCVLSSKSGLETDSEALVVSTVVVPCKMTLPLAVVDSAEVKIPKVNDISANSIAKEVSCDDEIVVHDSDIEVKVL
ncbi:PLU-1-like protein-domain-containing protein [Lipomyces oligophaga]|uniref:PLU-1-like protein-domain-containing protein n=1 Tax=Lipomyces oligophaga TaxID=45792 RepID=UPI0034CFDD89